MVEIKPFSLFEEYTCRECNKEWISNEALIGLCPICNGDTNIYYHPLITCPKCGGQYLEKKRVGNRERDYCYYCKNCEDQIAKEAVMRNRK